jgi:hypothetical protein
MKITVYNPIVRKNIELFKQLVERQTHKQERGMRALAASINCLTGDFSFAHEAGAQKEWKAVLLQVNDQGELELSEGAQEFLFQYTDLQLAAYQVMLETIEKLNQILKHLRPLDAEHIYREMQRLEIEFSKDIVHESWHQVDRAEAEFLLQGHPVGTFLFRRDEYAAILEDQLRVSLELSIKCVTLTFLGPKGKVSDLTLVRKEQHWVIYNDDPSLEGPAFPTIYAIIEKMKIHLRIPLIH